MFVGSNPTVAKMGASLSRKYRIHSRCEEEDIDKSSSTVKDKIDYNVSTRIFEIYHSPYSLLLNKRGDQINV